MVTNRLILSAALLAGAVGAVYSEEEAAESAAVKQMIQTAKKAGHSKTLMPDASGKPYSVQIDSLTPEGLLVVKDGGKMQIAWKQVKDLELFWMGRGLLADDDVDGYLTVARLGLKIGVGPEIDVALERQELAAPKEYARIERVRSAIADQLAATQVKPPPAAAKTKENDVSAAEKKDPASTASAAPPAAGSTPAASRSPGVNQEGRTLPPMPKFDKPVLYNTPEADAIAAALQVMPVDNAWNQDVSKLPVHAKSDVYVTAIGAAKHVHINRDMTYVLVPPNQATSQLSKMEYAGESDKGPFPIPDNTPIEGWPFDGGKLDDVQRNGDGDRHACVVDPFAGKFYDFYIMRKNDKGWEAACEATFDMKSNALRPKFWTSSDAAGLPIFPSLVRFDECERGMVEHALRFTIRRSRRAFIPPATHYASRSDDEALAPMGLRFRLKADVKIDDLPKHAKAVALALKKYGMFVADNGSDWFLSTSGDDRIKNLEALHRLKGSDFEAVETGQPLVLARGK
ncbi:MAG: hypothetical protein HY291_06000 [Planctomycetes bacterium]|nr:hypothetical protein [Planctomycetota bacterium]